METGFVAPPMPANEVRRSAAVVACGLLQPDAGWRLDELSLWARVAIGTRFAAITTLIGDTARMVGCSGLQAGEGWRATSFCGHTILAPVSVMCVPDAQLDPRFAGNPHVVSSPWLRFYAGVALATDDGLALGTLCVFDARPRAGMTMRETRTLLELGEEAMRRVAAVPTRTARTQPVR